MKGNIVEKQCLLLAVAYIFNYFEGFLTIGRVGGKVDLVVIATIIRNFSGIGRSIYKINTLMT